MIPGGKGANQAVAIARLGGNVKMFGCIGSDIYGGAVLDNLIKNKVDVSNVKKASNESTGVAFINIAEGDNSIIIVKGTNGLVDKEYIVSIKNKLLKSKMVLMQHEIPFDTVEFVVRLCYENNIPVILNPAPAMPVTKELIDMLSYITPNEHEAKIVFKTDEDIEHLVIKYPNKLIVTLGEKGAIYSDGNDVKRVPCIKANVVDTTGAGDTFSGAFTKAIVDGYSLDEAVSLGQYVGGMSVEKFGAQGGMPTYD